ncbi:hypothetical protein V498_09185 [Pseudogymnoascus sp. VKM F-4517 (FW-2822)]|nr:hypothetical protein V498_09185 [Pseudogymnoascus sp. VKM F-4517 (FW-2822)]
MNLNPHASAAPAQVENAMAIVILRIPGTAQEKRGFQYFITNTARELTGYYTSSFWEYLILQASAAEPSLRHAVIAIAALHEEFSNKRLGGVSPDHENAESLFAINQYMKAVSHLRRSLSAGKQAPLTALMSCLLFICFDYLRGHFDSAMMHLQSGLDILPDLSSRSKEDGDIVEQIMAPLFMRLTVQSILYIDTRNSFDQRRFAEKLMHVRTQEPALIPESFEDLEEARTALDMATNGLFRVFYTCDGK